MILTLPWPSSALHGHAKGNRWPKIKATKIHREAAWALALQAKVQRDPTAALTFTYHPPNNRRRDCQNMPGMLKPAIDGIAQAMGCDDHGFRVRYPDTFGECVKGGAVVVEIGGAA